LLLAVQKQAKVVCAAAFVLGFGRVDNRRVQRLWDNKASTQPYERLYYRFSRFTGARFIDVDSNGVVNLKHAKPLK